MFYIQFGASARPENAMNLQTFYDALSDLGEPDSVSKFWQIVPLLRAVASSPDQILQEVVEQILADLAGKAVLASSNSFVLKRPASYLIRANFWGTRKASGAYRQDEIKMYAYGMPHDHDFDLLTTCVVGPGYTTDVYSYTARASNDTIPSVECKPLGTYTVSRGDVLFLECNSDIHVQHPPTAPSVTLNVMSAVRATKSGQYIFDRDITRIVSIAENQTVRYIGLLENLAIFGMRSEWEELVRCGRRRWDRWVAIEAERMTETLKSNGAAGVSDGRWIRRFNERFPEVGT